MHRRSARARRIYACRSGRRKRPHRSAHLHCVVNGALESKRWRQQCSCLVLRGSDLASLTWISSRRFLLMRDHTRSCVSDGRHADPTPVRSDACGVAQSDGTDARSVATHLHRLCCLMTHQHARRRRAMHVHIKDAASCAHCPP